MTAGRDTEEFQQFFQRLIRSKPSPSVEPLVPTVTHVTVNGPVRCKIYIGMPFCTPSSEAKATDRPATPP